MNVYLVISDLGHVVAEVKGEAPDDAFRKYGNNPGFPGAVLHNPLLVLYQENVPRMTSLFYLTPIAGVPVGTCLGTPMVIRSENIYAAVPVLRDSELYNTYAAMVTGKPTVNQDQNQHPDAFDEPAQSVTEQ